MKLSKLIRHRFVFVLSCIVLLFLLLRVFVYEAYRMEDDAMEPCFRAGDYFLVNKFVFGNRIPFTDMRLLRFREVRRGDVIVFEYPEDPAKFFVRRVIALPGDTIEFRDKKVYINGSRFETPGVVHKERSIIPLEQNPRDNKAPVTVPVNAYFVLGDNRDHSYDSRFWGFLPDANVKGLVSVRYWSAKK